MYPVITGNGLAPITIQQVANAWLVILPNLQHIQPAYPSFDMDEMLKRGIDLVQEKLHGDDILAKIKAENEPVKKVKAPPPKISDLKDENIFSFKTFPEVLEFLAEKIK